MNDPILTFNQAPDVLLDDDLRDVASAARALGMKPVHAWVPGNNKKSGTAGAERTRRSREKSEQLGLKQLSITLPAELHPMLKALATRTKEGETVDAVLAELFPYRAAGQGLSPVVEPKIRPDLTFISGWRRFLIRWLLDDWSRQY